jgi:hypothetical protein
MLCNWGDHESFCVTVDSSRVPAEIQIRCGVCFHLHLWQMPFWPVWFLRKAHGCRISGQRSSLGQVMPFVATQFHCQWIPCKKKQKPSMKKQRKRQSLLCAWHDSLFLLLCQHACTPDRTARHLIQTSASSKQSSTAVILSHFLCRLNNLVPIGFPGSN